MKVGIKVGDVMTRKFVSVKPDITMAECAKIMVKKKVGSVIVKTDQKLKGILTEGDLVRAMAKGLDKKKTKISRIMTKKVHGIKPGKDISDALITMKNKGVRWLPVLADHNVIGLLTEKDVLKMQPDLFDIAFQNVKIAEEEEKFKRVRAVDEYRWVREGPCHECGAYDLLYKVGNLYLCADCRRKASGQWEE